LAISYWLLVEGSGDVNWFRYWPVPVVLGVGAAAIVLVGYVVVYSVLVLAGRDVALDHAITVLVLQPLGWGVVVGVLAAVYRWARARGPAPNQWCWEPEGMTRLDGHPRFRRGGGGVRTASCASSMRSAVSHARS
jgi:hypothetical protein